MTAKEIVFNRKEIDLIQKFEKEMGIKIPHQIFEKKSMHSSDYFFSSKPDFSGFISETEFFEIANTENDLVAFGHTGYGYNNYNFELCYIDDSFAYYLRIPFGGIYTDNKSALLKIQKELEKLPDLIAEHSKSKQPEKTIIFRF